MKFEEACREVLEKGKKYRKLDSPSVGIRRMCSVVEFFETKTQDKLLSFISLSDINSEWEEIKEKKTLRDKRKGSKNNADYWYDERDVKEALKEYLSSFPMECVTHSFAIEKAKEIFGEELVL